MQNQTSITVPYRPDSLYKNLFSGIFLAILAGYGSWYCWQTPFKSVKIMACMLLGPLLSLLGVWFVVGAILLLVSGKAALELTETGIIHYNLLGCVRRVAWNEFGSFVLRDNTGNVTETRILGLSGVNQGQMLFSIRVNDLSVDLNQLIQRFKQFRISRNDIECRAEIIDERQQK